jgi:hypothetical protein
VGVGILEEDGVFAENVQVRGLNARVTVGRQAVGPQRVHRNEDDRGRAEEEARLAPAAIDESPGQEREERPEETMFPAEGSTLHR